MLYRVPPTENVHYTQDRKKAATTAAFLWSLQGMILRPPDYESDALTN